jgi:hypothetical protein
VLTKVEASRPEHLVCHRKAAKRLRQELAANPALAGRLALRKKEDRLRRLAKERVALQRKLDAVEEEIILIEESIRFNGVRRCGHPPDEETCVPYPADDDKGSRALHFNAVVLGSSLARLTNQKHSLSIAYQQGGFN